MEQETIEKITKYMSVWGWQILAIIFFSSSLMFLALQRTAITISFFVAFFLGFIMCEYMTLRRKKEFYEEEGEDE